MSKQEKISLPGSGGGIFRTYDDEGTGIRLKPEHVVYTSAAVIAFEIILHFYGTALF